MGFGDKDKPTFEQRRAERILARHGVGGEQQELRRGPRDPEKIDAILQDIIAARAYDERWN